MDYDEVKDAVMKIVRDRKWQWVATILVLFVILMMSSSIRLSNWDLLTDSTTGEKIPLALDPYYFLRVSETIVENDGELPEFDDKRYVINQNVDWHPEIMPKLIVWMWKTSSIFGDYSLQAVNVFSPVFFYGIGLILFFGLVFVLTKSKFAGVLACSFLAFTPSYLYRTMAGFSDHESIGMVGFFATMIVFALALKYLEKNKGGGPLGAGIWGGVVGILTAITISLWGGVSTFIFIIVPIAFLILWIIITKDEKNTLRNNGFFFYSSWIIFTLLISIVLGYDISFILNKFISSDGIFSSAVLGFIFLDRILMIFEKKFQPKWYNKKYRLLYVLLLLIIVAIFVLPLIGRNLFSMVWETLNRLLNPLWGTNRTNTTVAENAQSFLTNWINASGKPMFAMFLAGIVAIAISFSQKIKNLKRKMLMISGFIFVSFGILFSKISPSSVLSGEGVFSLGGLLYIGGLCFFSYAFFKNYLHGFELKAANIFIFTWLFVMLVVGRSTTRMFFVIAPFICFVSAYLVVAAIRAYREGFKDEIGKIIIVSIIIVSLITSGAIIYSSYKSIENQAEFTGPSANNQWQKAMSWVRENTSEEAVFSHWWDYGYWVQTLGKRSTVADGGHFHWRYDGNHKLGRYVLTTPQPETALSFFKTMDVDYLLIDQTDLGKYPAYSKIGGGNDKEGKTHDRYSAIPVMPNDPKQTRETANGSMLVFSGGMYLFEDIMYNDGSKNIFLPSGKAAVVGVIMNLDEESLKQPEVAYVYNNVQTRIPARYVYFNGELIDFGNGLDVIIRIIPSFTGNSINPMGASIYLSQKVSKSLFARLFLLDDAFGEYETINLVHSEDNPVVASLKAQGVDLGEFVYYQGFRGPIKIWDVSKVPENIKVVEEFRDLFNGTYGTLDDLEFTEN